MKKLIFLWLMVLGMIVGFCACRTLKHEHIPDEWEAFESGHWRLVDCTWDKCDIDPAIQPHGDEDSDRICDVCGYQMLVEPHPYDCAGIDQATASEIKFAYCRFTCEKNYGGDLRFEPSDMIITRYEGKIGECHIVMMGGDEIGYGAAERGEEVAGYTLWFSDGQPVYAYHGGSFYTIGEAFEAGLLSREDVYKISTIFSPG